MKSYSRSDIFYFKGDGTLQSDGLCQMYLMRQNGLHMNELHEKQEQEKKKNMVLCKLSL